MGKKYLHIAKRLSVLDFDVKTSQSYRWEPGVAFCTAELKKASLKKSREPLKTTLALFLAWRPAIRRVFLPTAWGYLWGLQKKELVRKRANGLHSSILKQQSSWKFTWTRNSYCILWEQLQERMTMTFLPEWLVCRGNRSKRLKSRWGCPGQEGFLGLPPCWREQEDMHVSAWLDFQW